MKKIQSTVQTISCLSMFGFLGITWDLSKLMKCSIVLTTLAMSVSTFFCNPIKPLYLFSMHKMHKQIPLCAFVQSRNAQKYVTLYAFCFYHY